MIMRGTNADRLPRAVAWALAGLGLTLLVLRPVWADAPGAAPSPEQAPAVEQPTKDIPAGVVAVQPVREHAAGDVPAAQGQPGQPAHISVAQAQGSPPRGQFERAPVAEGEQLELLRAQLAAKEAELHEARAMLKLAQQRLKRMSQLHRNGTLGQDELEQAQADAEVQQARVQGKEAQLREAQLRMSMVARSGAGRRAAGPGASGSTSALPLMPPAGTPAAPPGAGAAPAASNAALALPGVAPPGAAHNPYTQSVPAMPRNQPAANPTRSRSTEERLDRLERDMQKLLKEIQRLRNQLPENRRAVPSDPAVESSRFRRQTDPFGGPGSTPSAAPDSRGRQ